MKKITFAVLCIFLMSFLPDDPFISNEDVSILQGEKWKGNLTYKDYGNGKEVNIPSNLSVSRLSDKSNQWIFSFEYPDEPHANSADTVTISDDGKIFDGETVIERSLTNEGYLKLLTIKTNDKKTMRYTYVISDKFYSARSEEKGAEDQDFFQRNIYIYNR